METPARIAELNLAAQDYVRQSLKLDLDGSLESLAFVDHYVRQVGNVTDQVLALVSAALGAYFGEVAISHLGGHWEIQGDDPAGWIVELEAAPVRFKPVAMAAEAIRSSDLEDYDASIRVPAELEGPLGEALEHASPVDAGYFYSLTGRIETLEQVASILAEIQRQSEERPASSDDDDPGSRPN